MTTGTARLSPPAGKTPAWFWFPLGPCDATASGSEDAQVQLRRELDEICLCGHHHRALETVLEASGWVITHDNRGL